eukprot:15478972-Alexandrium_andersonii.AAC.1
MARRTRALLERRASARASEARCSPLVCSPVGDRPRLARAPRQLRWLAPRPIPAGTAGGTTSVQQRGRLPKTAG